MIYFNKIERASDSASNGIKIKIVIFKNNVTVETVPSVAS